MSAPMKIYGPIEQAAIDRGYAAAELDRVAAKQAYTDQLMAQQLQAAQHNSAGPWIVPNSPSTAMTLDASGNLGLGTMTGSWGKTQPVITLGYERLTGNGIRLAGMQDLHPAMEPLLLTLLLNMAQSDDVTDRKNAIMHRKLPLSMAVMMCGDKDEEVRGLAETVVRYAQQEQNNE